MKDLKRIKGKYWLGRAIAEGENQHQDFKFLIADARKIARSISAFSNRSGGRLLIGVKDNGTIAGVRSEEDIYMIESAASIYCSPSVEVTFTAINAGDGLTVIVADIPEAKAKPVCVREATNHQQAYVRIADENILAPELMVKCWRTLQRSKSHISLTAQHHRVIEALSSNGILTFEQLLKTGPISHNTATQLVCELYRYGKVTFEYHRPCFMIKWIEQPV